MFWVKDKEAPTGNLPNDLTHESYLTFRAGALAQRAAATTDACPHDMDILYQFWAHFLVRHFNARMYAEFRACAAEDRAAAAPSSPALATGYRYLLGFYFEALLVERRLPDGVVRDLLELVRAERGQAERPAFDRLRSAWRNGKFLKSRPKLMRMIDAELTAELDK